MPGAAATTYGIEFTQCAAVTTMPGLRSSPAAMEVGVPAVDHRERVGVALHLDLVALALGAERPGRVEVLLAHQPVHGRPGPRRCRRRRPPRRTAGPRPGPARSGRSASSIVARATAISWVGTISASAKPSASRHIRTDWVKPPRGSSSIGPCHRLLRGAAEAHEAAQHVRRGVAPDVGELLAADEPHAPSSATRTGAGAGRWRRRG